EGLARLVDVVGHDAEHAVLVAVHHRHADEVDLVVLKGRKHVGQAAGLVFKEDRDLLGGLHDEPSCKRLTRYQDAARTGPATFSECTAILTGRRARSSKMSPAAPAPPVFFRPRATAGKPSAVEYRLRDEHPPPASP